MQIKYCSMHSLNLGYALWVAGGAITILCDDVQVWGGDERNKADRLLDAWMDFKNWAKTNRIQYLDII